MSHELTFKQWHHGYLGLLLIAYGLVQEVPLFVVTGSILVADDLLQHSVQYLTQTEWQSPLRRLYGLVYAKSAVVRAVNRWLDELFQ